MTRESDPNNLSKGLAEQALIFAALAAAADGLDPEIAGEFIEIAVEGGKERAEEATESLIRNLDKLRGNVG